MILSDILGGKKEQKDKLAVITSDMGFTYGEIRSKVEQLSFAFQKQGLQAGDRVAVLLKNSVESIISYFAITKIGAIEVALNPLTESLSNIIYSLNDCAVKALITEEKLVDSQGMLPQVPSLKHIFLTNKSFTSDNLSEACVSFHALFNLGSGVKSHRINERSPALIAYTSGTTGVPKGVVLTHRSLLSAANASIEDLGITSDDRSLLLIPLSHPYGKRVLNSRFMQSAAVVIKENIIFPVQILKLIQQLGVTGMTGFPTIYIQILEVLAKGKTEFDLHSVRYITTGASKMPIEKFHEMRERFPQAIILSGYGLAETSARVSRIVFPPDKPLDNKLLESCGKPTSPNKIAIVDKNGDAVPSDVVGEVKFKGPNVMLGYWNKEKETKEVLTDGWFKTGDYGKIDSEGNLYLLGRKKDLVKSCGELISPMEVEAVINRLAGIEECAIIGVEDQIMGEVLKAFIVFKSGFNLSKEEIIKYCQDQLPMVKIPAQIEFCASLPRSNLGKVNKGILKKGKE